LIVDVSSNNGSKRLNNLPDWNLASKRVKFAILRSTMGAAGLDPSFKYNVEQALHYGVGVGAYHFFRPDSTGYAQAINFLKAVQPYEIKYLAVDVEPTVDGTDSSPTVYADELLSFIEEVKLWTGEYPRIYTNFESWRVLVGTQHDETFKKCRLWVANYTNAPAPLLPRSWSTWELWQYTSSGSVEGLSKTWNGSSFVWGRTDLNRKNIMSKLNFVLPMDAPFKTTQKYGANKPYYNKLGLPEGHEGVDGYGTSDRVYSVADGVVKLVAKDNSVHPYGNHIRIAHEGGYESIYAHLRGFKDGLVAGSPVVAGQLIGYMGNTGNVIKSATSSGIHLHLSIKLNGKVIDPADVIDFGES